MGPHQHPHSHPHHEPSRQFQRPVSSVLSYSAPRQSGLDVVNPRILDASIHDVTERLSNEQKAEVLIHAMNLLKLANPFSHHIVENGVVSCLQSAQLGTPQKVQLYLLRGRARMAVGDIAKAREDLYRVLDLVPDHSVATSLLSIPQSASTSSKDSRLWNIESASRRLSPEVWRRIAEFLPRRDLKTLLHIPHVLSRIAFERVFQRIDLDLGACILAGEKVLWKNGDFYDDPDRPGLRLEKKLAQRTADIVARIVLDPSFAKLVKTVRISAGRRDASHHMAFQTTMLATALPKLLNLKEVIFTGSNEVWARLADVLSATHPRLQSLILDLEHDAEPVLPHLTHLTQFKLVKDHAAHALPAFLAQNRATLRKLCLCTYYAPFPPAPNSVALSQLTHLEFVGSVQTTMTTGSVGSNSGNVGSGNNSATSTDAIALILTQAVNLISLRMCCVLLANAAPHFRKYAAALPRLRRFGFRVLDQHGFGHADVAGTGVGASGGPNMTGGGAGNNGDSLFSALSQFLRGHPELERLELDVAGEANQARLGYDATVLGVLPSLPKLQGLSITLTKDASPGLFSWIVPRGLKALLLSGVPRRGAEVFLNTMRPGLPPDLRYISLPDMDAISDSRGGVGGGVAYVVENLLPPSVQLVSVGERHYSIRRRIDGHLDTLEEWPERRMALHAEEWLEALRCEEALWDDFAPGGW